MILMKFYKFKFIMLMCIFLLSPNEKFLAHKFINHSSNLSLIESLLLKDDLTELKENLDTIENSNNIKYNLYNLS